jgi:hypothetical protein
MNQILNKDTEKMDFAALREEGIRGLQSLSGHLWTDYNTHDPGVTILEQLCYALTDLHYRAGFTIQDMMAERGDAHLQAAFQPRAMLHCGPVSLSDWRRLLLDIPGVRNAWISPVDTLDSNYQPALYYDEVEASLILNAIVTREYAEPLALKGLYRVDYVLEDPQMFGEENISTEIRARMQAHRNLCEDLHQINRLTEEYITVAGRVEIDAVPDPERVLAQIYGQIHAYMSPSIRFHTLQEMSAKGYALDDIMQGPRLEHGFLEQQELDAFVLRQNLRISDLIQLIMEVEGVIAVHSLKLTSTSGLMAATDAGAPWELSVPGGRVARLFIPGETNTDAVLQLWHNSLEQQVDWRQWWKSLKGIMQQEQLKKTPKSDAELDQKMPPGQKREIGMHQSILHQFPDIYGLGLQGLPVGSSPLRQAQARQLKAYLSFFDQILANTFSQLASTSAFFGLGANWGDATYFSQSLRGEAPGLEELIDPDEYEALLTNPGLKDDANINRLKRLNQHLLARFAELFTDFSQQDFALQKLAQQRFISDYPALGYHRFKAFDYTQAGDNAANVSGLEQRLNHLLGFWESRPDRLSAVDAEHPGAFHLVEHMLLRPVAGDVHQHSPILLLPFNGDNNSPPLKDPYSLQLSFVFPDWLNRINDTKFQSFLLKTLREQTPAHLKIYVHWLDQETMDAFETAYRDWLGQLKYTLR